MHTNTDTHSSARWRIFGFAALQWRPQELTVPEVDSEFEQMGVIERTPEVLRYSLLRFEYWISPRGNLREWMRWNTAVAVQDRWRPDGPLPRLGLMGSGNGNPDYARHFRGNTSDGQFDLRRPNPERRETADAPDPAKGFDNPELKRALSGSTWEMKDGKRFTLHADGSTTANWHERKGYWRIVGPKTIELKIWWKPRPAEQLSVDADARSLRWNDEAFGGIAKRVDGVHDTREKNQP